MKLSTFLSVIFHIICAFMPVIFFKFSGQAMDANHLWNDIPLWVLNGAVQGRGNCLFFRKSFLKFDYKGWHRV